jgi:hypothetical protein
MEALIRSASSLKLHPPGRSNAPDHARIDPIRGNRAFYVGIAWGAALYETISANLPAPHFRTRKTTDIGTL